MTSKKDKIKEKASQIQNQAINLSPVSFYSLWKKLFSEIHGKPKKIRDYKNILKLILRFKNYNRKENPKN